MFPERGAVLPRVADALLHRALTRYGTAYRGEPMARHTTFGVGGRAFYYALPESGAALAAMIGLCREHGLPYIVLGGGSNVLFPDSKFPGVVIGTARIDTVVVDPPYVDVGAGVPSGKLIARLHRTGVHSLDFLAGIPGTIGGAIAMNAGIQERTIGEVTEHVWALADDALTRFSRAESLFSYRGSLFRAARLPILGARLRLDGPRYDAAYLLRQRAANQPLAAHSAGCVFKNPPGDSAGRLIDDAGLKGLRVGMAKVSEKHANFILNLGGARSADIRKLIDIVREKVYKSFCILLELEIEVIDG